MSNQKDVIYAILINMMIEEGLIFNWEIAKGSYGWSKSTFYNFIQFVKKINCFEVIREKTGEGYSLKVKSEL